MIRKFIIGLGMILADVVFLSCFLYFMVMLRKAEQAETHLLLWIAIGAVGFLINLFMAKKQKSIGNFLAVNVLVMVISCILAMLSCSPDSMGFWLKAAVCVGLCIVVGHGCYMAWMPMKVEHSVLMLDALVVVVALFLAGCEMRKPDDVLALQILGLLSVGYMLAALVFLRTFQEEDQVVRGGELRGRAGIFGGLAAIILFSILLCVLFSIRLSGAVENLWDAFLYVLTHVKEGLVELGQRLAFFFQRFADQTGADTPLTGAQSSASNSQNEWMPAREFPMWLTTAVFVVIVGLVAFFVIRAILKLRHENVSGITGKNRRMIIKRETMEQKWPSLFERIRRKVYLLRRRRELKKTPIGLAVLSRKCGAAAGISMENMETWHGYVRRLSRLVDSEILWELALLLEQYFYSGSQMELTAKQYQLYAAELKKFQEDFGNKSR